MKRFKRNLAMAWPLLVIYVATGIVVRAFPHLGWAIDVFAVIVLFAISMVAQDMVRDRWKRNVPQVPGISQAADDASDESGQLPQRTSELAFARPVRAAGSNTISDAVRYSRRAGHWQPTGDPDANRTALLAGQSFRVFAYRRDGRRWAGGRLDIGGQPLTVTWRKGFPGRGLTVDLTPPAAVVRTGPVDPAQGWFPNKDWLFTTLTLTITTAVGREVLAVPTIDVPLVALALELATAENSDVPGA